MRGALVAIVSAMVMSGCSPGGGIDPRIPVFCVYPDASFCECSVNSSRCSSLSTSQTDLATCPSVDCPTDCTRAPNYPAGTPVDTVAPICDCASAHTCPDAG